MQRILLLVSFFLPAFVPALAQTPQAGLYELGPFDNPGVDTINRGNLNVHLSIPVVNKPGRGGTNFSLMLNYDSLVWAPTSLSATSAWTPVANWGWTTESTAEFGYVSFKTETSTCSPSGGKLGSGVRYIYLEFIYQDKSGKGHLFNYEGDTGCNNANGNGFTGSGTYAAEDNSGYTIYRNGSLFTVFSRTGEQFHVGAVPRSTGVYATIPTQGSYIDTNGNEVTATDSGVFTDTLGTTALTVAGTVSTTAASAKTYTYTDTTGTPRSITVNYTIYSVATNFGVSGITEYSNTSVPLISSIVYPDGTQYAFTYEPTPGASGKVTGRIASIAQPAGGVVSYTYTGGSNGIESDGSPSGITRMTSDATVPATYVRSAVTTTGSTTTFTDASSNVTVSNYLESTLGYSYETSRSTYAGAATGTPLQQVTTCYVATSGCLSETVEAPINFQIAQLTQNGIVLGTDTRQYSGGILVSDNNGFITETTAYQTFTGPNSIPFYRVSSVTDTAGSTQIAQTTYTYDQTTPTATTGLPSHVAVTTSRGNLTTISPWLNTTNAVFGATTNTYYDTGSLYTTVTPNGTSTYGYDTTGSYATALSPPTPSSGVSLPSSATYDSNTGLPLTGTDPNSAQVAYKTYDSMLRPTELDSLDSSGNTVGKITYSYSANQSGVQTYQSASVYADTETHYDGYGRVDRVAVANGQSTNGWYEQDSCFDVNGRLLFKSYTFASTGLSGAKSCSGSGDTYAYDALGRVTKITHADNTTINYSYNGRATQTIDENNVTRITQTDFMGRPTIVCEVAPIAAPTSDASTCTGSDISATGYTTTYAYNLPTHTTTITQGAQTRSFVTDSLGRTTSVAEPESGTTTYSFAYNSTGLVVTRSRPTANQTSSTVLTTTTTQYDSLSRPVSITYSDSTPTKIYDYDKIIGQAGYAQTYLKGRLTYLASGNTKAANSYSYDALGRVIENGQCLPSTCGTSSVNLTYSYDWQGNLLSSSDGAGVTTSYNSYTPAGEIGSMTTSLTGSTHPQIFYGATYGPNGPISYRFGNGLSQYNTYTTLGKINGSWVCGGTFPSQACDYQGGVSVYQFDTNWSGSNVTYFEDQVAAPGTSAKNLFTYDKLNRLQGVSYNAGATTFSWTYDRYGNRLAQNAPQGGPQPSYTFNTAKNQISTMTYDALGNVLNDGFHSYLYDAENNLVTVDAGNKTASTYTYDALNRRVRQDLATGSQEFVFNLNGQRASIWNPVTETQIQGQFYWGSKPVAFYTLASGQTFFQHQDWVGTERTRTTYNGAVAGTFSSLPFGDNYTVASGTDTDAYHFASLDLDSTSSTSHAQFRQYSNTAGRWMSPDPYLGSYDATNPQSMNRYSYALNNPSVYSDPRGLDRCVDHGGNTIIDSEGGDNIENCSGIGGTWIIEQDPTNVTGVDGNSSDSDTEVTTYYNGYDPSEQGINSSAGPNKPVPTNPCTQSGNAPDPHFYQQKGLNARNNPLTSGLDLAQFPRGGDLDAQPNGGSRAYGNYVYGVYMRAAGFPLFIATAGARWYAMTSNAQYGPADGAMSGSVPSANVTNITNGYNAQKNGTVCHVIP